MTTPRGHTASACRPERAGMILPLVLLVMLLVAVMTLALQSAAWRAARGARTHWDLQRALYAADLGVLRIVGTWAPESVATSTIGLPRHYDHTGPGGWQTRVSVTRTAPLTAAVHAVSTYSRSRGAPVAFGQLGDAGGVRREVLRIVRLAPPDIPMRAAATMLGTVVWDSAGVDGRVVASAIGDDCGPLRDTTTADAIVAPAQLAGAPPTVIGAHVTPPALLITSLQQRFDQAWPVLMARAHAVDATLTPSVPRGPPWRATVMTGAGVVTVTDTVAYVGALAIDGDLVVRGALHVSGALIVRGAVDASAGQLQVDGTLVVRDLHARNSPLSAATRIRYAPCVVGRAMTALALPTNAPFGIWNSP